MSRACNDHPSAADARNPGRAVDYDLFLRCVHCGQCTATCPTFVERGDENDGPRGRIQLMRMVADGQANLTDRMRRHLDGCLDCRSCETACPSGVEYGRLIEPFRLAAAAADTRIERRADWFRELVLFRLLPCPPRLRRLLLPVRFFQRAGVFRAAERLGLLGLIPGRPGRLVDLLPMPVRPGPKLPRFLPAEGRRRARVAFFVGCVADSMFRHVHWATLRVLQRNGCDVFIPEEQGCCGSIHWHAGNGRAARAMADANLIAFELDRYDAIVVNHAGCGSMMKEYGLHWRDGLQPHRARFAAKVFDVHEFLDRLGMVAPGGRIEAVATYHDACQLGHAQAIRAAPRRLLAKIPGLDLRELPEAELCCGAAGTYHFDQPAMADQLSRRKLENILSTGARLVLAADAACLLQIAREARHGGHRLLALHPMELLDLSYRDEQPAWPE